MIRVEGLSRSFKFRRRVLLSILFFGGLQAWARPSGGSRAPDAYSADNSAAYSVSYDLSLSSGSTNQVSYTEANIGLNWSMREWLIWRNALFSRFASGLDTVVGLDTSMRFVEGLNSESGAFGLDLFAGPGLRFANQDSNAVFVEAGLGFKLGGIYIGGGVKSLYYTSPRQDSQGHELDKNDTLFFIVLSGGGRL